jgi:CubicO group peptidase (beta-lactamase class C family)
VEALRLTRSWPVANVAAAVVDPSGTVTTTGDQQHPFRIASVAKLVTAWACLIAVEEGIVTLDQPVGQPGCTLRHLLAHAGGYGFDGEAPIAAPQRTRIYSNTGIEMAAACVAAAAAIDFAVYVHEAVLQPLGMSCTAADLTTFVGEVREPRLLSKQMVAAATSIQYPELNGVVPGVGRFSPCPWGLGFEIRGTKRPHWTGTTNSPQTFGHFGGAGTFLWVDPAVGVACLSLTDRPFDEWSQQALRSWSALSDAVLGEVAA